MPKVIFHLHRNMSRSKQRYKPVSHSCQNKIYAVKYSCKMTHDSTPQTQEEEVVHRWTLYCSPVGLQDVNDPNEQQEALSFYANSWNTTHPVYAHTDAHSKFYSYKQQMLINTKSVRRRRTCRRGLEFRGTWSLPGSTPWPWSTRPSEPQASFHRWRLLQVSPGTGALAQLAFCCGCRAANCSPWSWSFPEPGRKKTRVSGCDILGTHPKHALDCVLTRQSLCRVLTRAP